MSMTDTNTLRALAEDPERYMDMHGEDTWIDSACDGILALLLVFLAWVGSLLRRFYFLVFKNLRQLNIRQPLVDFFGLLEARVPPHFNHAALLE